MQAYPRLRPDSDVKAWLVTIAHRKALDILRRRARHAVPMAEIPERPDGAEPAVADDGLWLAVRALPDKQRHAVAYRYVGDMAYPEVAPFRGTSDAAARRNAAGHQGAQTQLSARQRIPTQSGGNAVNELERLLAGSTA